MLEGLETIWNVQPYKRFYSCSTFGSCKNWTAKPFVSQKRKTKCILEKEKVIRYRQFISNSVKTCQTGFEMQHMLQPLFRVQGDKIMPYKMMSWYKFHIFVFSIKYIYSYL